MGDGPHTILLAKAESAATDALASALARPGVQVDSASQADEVVKRAASGELALLVIDAELPGALELLSAVRELPRRSFLPVMLLAGEGAAQLRVDAFLLGADDVLTAPWTDAELQARVGRLLQVRRQFEQLVEESDQLHQLAVTDGLTQVHNHRYFQERLKEEFRRAQRYDDALALVLLDIDHFKEVNDSFGHPVGDQVLKDVANAIRTNIRDTDLLARYGGEEFCILLPRTPVAGALTVAERVWRGIAALRTGTTGQVRVTASLGISGFPNRAVLTPEQLVQTADDALYRAKKEGRNKICLFQQVSFFADPPARVS